MSYNRVIPRDLFNESKLLKCIGRLCLLIHDRQVPFNARIDDTGERFLIELNEDNNELHISNLEIIINKVKGIQFFIPYNSKDNYPLYCRFREEEYKVFYEGGNLHSDFIDFTK